MLYFVALRGGLANNGAGFVLWTRALGLVLFGRAFRDSCFGSFFSWFVLLGSCFWSFFSWFVLLFVLLVVLFVVRSFRDSCFWELVCVFCSML